MTNPNPNNHQFLHNTPENRDYWQNVVGIQQPDVDDCDHNRSEQADYWLALIDIDIDHTTRGKCLRVWLSAEYEAREEQADYWLCVIEWEDQMRQNAVDCDAWHAGIPSTCLKCGREKPPQAPCDCELPF